MTNELESNLARIIKAGADPFDSKRAARMAREFARRAAGGSTSINWGRITLAASLLICAFVLWRVTMIAPPKSSQPAAPQEQPKDDIAALIEKLGSSELADRDRAKTDLIKLGDKAVAALQKLLQSQDAEIRSRAQSVLTAIDRAQFQGAKIFAGRNDRKKLAEAAGGGDDTEKAILAALKWLQKHQSNDGSWKCSGQLEKCDRDADCGEGIGDADWTIGATGLALQAFLGAGYTPQSKEFGDAIGKGLDFLVRSQALDGSFDAKSKGMYSSAIATQAVIEGSVLANDEALKKVAQKAIDYLASAKNPGAAWRYTSRSGDNDSSVSYWALQAVRTGWHSGFLVSNDIFEESMNWVDSVTAGTGSVGYHMMGTGKVFVPGKNDKFNNHESMAGGATFNRLFVRGELSDPSVRNAVGLLCSDLPTWDETKIDFYYWHLGTQGMFQASGPHGVEWRGWNTALKTALLPNQCKEGCQAGSWNPVDRWGFEAGRIYATALNAITLETYYRFKIVGK